MKKTFTLRTLLFKAVFAFLLLAVTNVQGQKAYTFTVNSPAGIAGEYDVIHATFGPICGEDSATGDLTIGDDGTAMPTQCCNPLTNDLTGQVALIDRGSCNFSIKCYNAQVAGAVAVVICNNNTDPIFAMGAGANGDLVTIPSVMMSMADCATIRAEIPTVNVTIAPITEMAPPDTDIIYYEEDFNTGPNGWTSASFNEPDEVFYWDEFGAFPTFGGGTVTSPLPGSSCTGAMGYPSGYYQTGMTGNPDSVPATYIDFNAELISPTLDLSGITEAISLKFNQSVQRLNYNTAAGFAFVAYSLDDGGTWSDNIPINADVPINSSVEPNPPTNNTVKVGIPAIQGQSNVKIKLIWACDFYYWIIDDVKLVRRPSHDLSIPEDFFAQAPNAMTPISQAEPWGFVTDVKNEGADPQTNVNLNVTITDDNTSTVVFDEDLSYNTIEPDSNIMNVPFPVNYTHDGMTVSTYTGVYTVSADSADANPSDNQLSFQFMTTDTTFAKEFVPANGVRPADSNWDAGEVHAWSYGNYYHIVDGSYVGSSVSFGLVGDDNPDGDNNAGEFVTANLYKYDDTNGDNIIQSNERISIAFANYLITGDELGDQLITLALIPAQPENGEMGKINLDDDTGYLIMVQFAPVEIGKDLQISAGSGWDYSPTEFRTDQTAFGDLPYRPADFIGLGDPSSADFEINGFNNLVPAVRLNINESTPPIAVNELDAVNIVTLSPNPANEYINLTVDLVNTQAAQVRFVDVAGRVIFSTSYQDVSETTFKYNVSQFPAGTYYLHFVTKEGGKAVPFVVVK